MKNERKLRKKYKRTKINAENHLPNEPLKFCVHATINILLPLKNCNRISVKLHSCIEILYGCGYQGTSIELIFANHVQIN